MNGEENKQLQQSHVDHLTSSSKLAKCGFEYSQIWSPTSRNKGTKVAFGRIVMNNQLNPGVPK